MVKNLARQLSLAGSSLSGTVPQLKIALVGDSECGKTSVLMRYVHNQFSPLYIPTKKVVIENAVRKLNIPAGRVVSLALWDIPGKEDMDLYKSYFRNLDAAIVVVDMTDDSSMNMSPVWKQIVLINTTQTQTTLENTNNNQVTTITVEETPVDPETFPILLLGTKYDIIEHKIRAERLKFLDSNPNIEDIRPWIGPDGKEIKPACVQKLEDIAREHNFVSSVHVSSKDADNTVHLALQSLVRHVLEKKFLPRKLKEKEQKVEKEKKVEIFYEKLEMTDVESFDEVFVQGDTCIKKLAMLMHYHEVAWAKFKQTCFKAEVITKDENSIEDCIQGLKNKMPEGFQIKKVKDEGFYKLEIVKDNMDKKLPKAVKKAVKCFNDEYVVVSKTILTECPQLESLLKDFDTIIGKLCEKPLPVLLPLDDGEEGQVLGYTQEKVTEISSIVEHNRAKICHSQTECQEAVKDVKTARKKIKMAFDW